MSKLYSKVEEFVVKSFAKVDTSRSMQHFKETVNWIKKLKPDADEALLIAGVAHDIERAFRKDDVFKKAIKYSFDDLRFLRLHEKRGADIVCCFLKKQGAEEALIKKVHYLVSRHEEGGDEDTDILKDADSLSFFFDNSDRFILKRKYYVKGKKGMKNKVDWMYNRISSNKAKEIVRKKYEEITRKLEKIEF